MAKIRKRITYANVVATLALFLALGGGVYAASKINGKHIKKNSIAGNRLKPDTLTGRQIEESSLGKVSNAQQADSATHADSATSADSATTSANALALNGREASSFASAADIRLVRFDVTTTTSVVPQTVLDLGPLTVKAACTSGLVREIALTASTSTQGAGWDLGYVQDATDQKTSGGALDSTSQKVLGVEVSGNSHRLVGNLIYNDPTTSITLPFVVFVTNSGGTTRCFFTGTATRATSG
jgi:hypothetical protein